MSSERLLVLLLYISRSGSTFLSRQLDGQPDISVSIETKVLQNLLEIQGSGPASPDERIDALDQLDFRFKRLVPDFRILKDSFETAKGAPEQAQAILASHFGESNGSEVWVVKCNMAMPWLDALAKGYPKLKFLHIVRDGRGVLNSKLNTKRVYKSGNMAAEVFSPASRWRLYLETVDKLDAAYPGRVHEVRYEALVTDVEGEISRIREFFGLPREGLKCEQAGSDYSDKIPEQERSLHANVAKGPQTEFLDKWRTSLSSGDIMLFEWFDGEILADRGYEPLYSREEIVSSPKFWMAYVRNFVKMVARKIRYKLARVFPSVCGFKEREE